MEKIKLRWGVEQRLEFIEFVLFWEGMIKRGDLMDRFGVSVPQASADIKQYREIAPNNIEYDGQLKRYIAADAFLPALTEPNADDYLSFVRGGEGQEGLTPYLPPHDRLILPERVVSPLVLQFVVRGIRNKSDVQIRYQSMTRPKPIWRWVAPHALAHDGRRWHFRAYCHIDGHFKDFLLCRVLECKAERESDVSPDNDKDWKEIIEVQIAPNSDLPLGQQKVIALDYGMRRGVIKMTVRRSMLYYLLQKLNLLDDKHLTSTPKYLELRNPEEVVPLINNQKQSEI
jgi:predicted DNA-binding transcriptional regulator YafY